MQYAVENGMIDLAYVQEQIEMNKRKELIENHPYSIWQGKASRAFRARIWRQKSDMESCLKEIRRFAACMEYAKDEYLRCEQDNKENLEEI